MSKKYKKPYSPTYKWGQYDYGKGSYYDNYGFDYSYKDTKDYSPYDHYQKTGIWQGYAYQPKIERRYVEQMANAFASSYNVNIKEGEKWALNLSTKTLEYNPDTLLEDTKSMVIALLLHEIGHLLHTSIIEHKESPRWLVPYPHSAGEILNLYEDFRIDEIMRQSYTGANEVYDSFEDMKDEIALEYTDKKTMILQSISELKEVIIKRINEKKIKGKSDIDDWFPNQTVPQIMAKIQVMQDKAMIRAKFMEYCAGISIYPRKLANISSEVQGLVDKTHHAIWLATASKDTRTLFIMLLTNVYPPIEYLLKEMNDQMTQDEMEKMAGALSKWFAEKLANACDGISDNPKENNGKTDTKTHAQRNAGNKREAKIWKTGNYKEVLDSVQNDIARLSRTILNLKKKDEVQSWEMRKRSGRFNVKSAWKHRINDTHLFKKPSAKTDKILSYCFSFAVDISGSMRREDIENAEKSMILLAKVLEKVSIPYEIVAFDRSIKSIKQWKDKLSNNAVKEKLGALRDMTGGGTDVLKVITQNTIKHRTERNKIIMLLSDGAIS